MGQYSLEHYERYPTIKCRPPEAAGTPENPGSGGFQTIVCSWRDTEPRQGDFQLEKLRKKIYTCRQSAVLQLEPTPPDWAAHAGGNKRAAWEESWMRRIAALLDGGKALFAVILRSREESASPARLEAMFEAFDQCWKLLSVSDGRAVAQARRHGYRFGLLAELGRAPFDCCDGFARHGLQRLWEEAPVLVRGCGAPEELLCKLARQWHACLVEQPGAAESAAGYRLALRRLTYPASLTAGGAAPLRFWWTNSGQSPCYIPCRARLRLKSSAAAYEIPLGDAPALWPMGDRVWNEIARLPNAPAGEYELLCGVFDHDGNPLRLAMEGEAAGGFYSVGRAVLDGKPRAELEHAWDGYYPEGYYPLEDPAVPGSE